MSDEELARKSAYILGESSAAAQAVSELDRRRAAGENVSIYQVQQRWVVGPRADLVPPGKWKVDMPDGLYTSMPGDPPGPADLRKVIGGYVYECEPRTGRLFAAEPPTGFRLQKFNEDMARRTAGAREDALRRAGAAGLLPGPDVVGVRVDRNQTDGGQTPTPD